MKKLIINVLILLITVILLSIPLLTGIFLGLIKNSFLSGLYIADAFSEWLLDWMRG